VAIVALIAVRTARAPLTAFATNSVAQEGGIGSTKGNTTFCQSGETVPAGAQAMRVSLSVNVGPKVKLTVTQGRQVLTEGTQPAGWTGEQATIPVTPLPAAATGATICLAIGPAVEPIELGGTKAKHPTGEEPGKARIEYLKPGNRTWLGMAGTIAHRLGMGRSPSGTWIAFVPILLMAAAAAIVAWLVLREMGGAKATVKKKTAKGLKGAARRVPSAAWACGAVAWLSAASWGIVMAPFQVPDEPSHFAYVQTLAETGKLPGKSTVNYAPEEIVTLTDLDHNEVRYNALKGTINTTAQQEKLDHYLAQPIPRHGEGAAGVATTQPPLYYAAEAVPYLLGSSGNLLQRQALMRLLSAVFAGITAICAWLFLREALPKARWAWTVGAAGVALFPLEGFMSGAVNPDSMLAAVAAALFFCLARAFRHGLTTRAAVAIGVVTAAGFLTKLNFIGLVPGIALALVLLTRREAKNEGRAALRKLAAAAAVGASPVCVYALLNALSNHPSLGLASIGLAQTGKQGSIFREVSYIWQFWLPRLPGMANYFPGLSSTRLWFDRSVGLYGWLDTTFPQWVYNAAVVPAALIAAGCLAGLAASRTELRRRAGEVAAYATMGLGVMVLVGADSYLEFPGRSGGYTEPRYLLPMAVLFGAMLALAARGAGKRRGPVAGVAIIVAIFGHDVFSQLLVVSRYYG
jgi:Predicted membrane protein (DUF2142)